MIGCWYWRHNSSVQFCQVPTAETDFEQAPRKEIDSIEDTQQEVTINQLETETRNDDDVAIGISKRSGI